MFSVLKCDLIFMLEIKLYLLLIILVNYVMFVIPEI